MAARGDEVDDYVFGKCGINMFPRTRPNIDRRTIRITRMNLLKD